MLAAAGSILAVACSNNSGASPACGDLLACCAAMATPDLQAMCMANLPSSGDQAACSSQLSKMLSQGMCSDAGGGSGADGGPGTTCQTATFSCGPGGSLEYCHTVTASGACVDPYYTVGGQTFACTTCADLSACGNAARAYCQGNGDAGTD